jgi:hypothetical protein
VLLVLGSNQPAHTIMNTELQGGCREFSLGSLFSGLAGVRFLLRGGRGRCSTSAGAGGRRNDERERFGAGTGPRVSRCR